MPNYHYKGKDKFGKTVSGIMSAENENAVILKLNQSGSVPISIAETKETIQASHFFNPSLKVASADLNIFTRQLSALQAAGVPIISSLRALRTQIENKILQEVIAQIVRDVESGLSLSAALAKFPFIFNTLYINMVASGEASGKLDAALERLAVLIEHDETIRLRIKSATRYPIIIVIAMVVGFIALTLLVIPRYAKIYSQSTTALPLPTQVLLGINYLFTKFWWLLIILGIAAYALFKKIIGTKSGLILWDSFKLKIPVLGPMLLKLSISRFTRITGILMHSGIPILKILNISSESTGNQVVSQAIIKIKDSVSEGKGIAEPMKASGLFPPIVTQMVSIGEETGKLDDLLIHVSKYYDEQVDYTINNLTTLIEPILIVTLGLGVLFMALGIFLPMWGMMNVFKR